MRKRSTSYKKLVKKRTTPHFNFSLARVVVTNNDEDTKWEHGFFGPEFCAKRFLKHSRTLEHLFQSLLKLDTCIYEEKKSRMRLLFWRIGYNI